MKNGWMLLRDLFDHDRVCYFTNDEPGRNNQIYLVYLGDETRYYLVNEKPLRFKRFEKEKEKERE